MLLLELRWGVWTDQLSTQLNQLLSDDQKIKWNNQWGFKWTDENHENVDQLIIWIEYKVLSKNMCAQGINVCARFDTHAHGFVSST